MAASAATRRDSAGGASLSAAAVAAAARAQARNRKKTSYLSSGTLKKIVVVSLVGMAAWFYQAIQPPPTRICGSPNGPPVESPRLRLKDGRNLSYMEWGVPKEEAQAKIVYIHGFDSCKYDVPPLSKEVAEELGVYLVSFDRAGYGESDPNPKRTEKSTAMDVEDLADQLGLGSKFYVIGFSMGGQATWGCLKYIPHRLAGVGLLTPVINYWWPGFPANLSREAYYGNQLGADQWALRIAHYLPWLTYWWNTRRWIPPSNVIAYNPALFPPEDVKLLLKFADRAAYYHKVRQQGEYESLHRDMMVGFGNWEFDPMEIDDLFTGSKTRVHLWQGDEDRLVPVKLQRYVASRLPWIHYHELPGAGHLFPLADGMFDSVIKTLLLG